MYSAKNYFSSKSNTYSNFASRRTFTIACNRFAALRKHSNYIQTLRHLNIVQKITLNYINETNTTAK